MNSRKRYFVKGVVPGVRGPVILVIRAKSKKYAIARALANYNISKVLEVRDKTFNQTRRTLTRRSSVQYISALNGHRRHGGKVATVTGRRTG